MTRSGRLGFRPGQPATPSDRRGLVRLADAQGDSAGWAYVPPSTDPPARLVLLLHGAGGDARDALELLRGDADEHGLLLVAPQATRATWDVIVGSYGPDVRRIDALLGDIAGAHPVARLTVGGFSDGASYALCLGLANGDVFDSVLAFSPGFAAPLVTYGRPRVFVSHGDSDAVLPVDRCGRRVVGRLRDAGYPVTYEEFAGGHSVPAAIVRRAVGWLVAEGPAERQ